MRSPVIVAELGVVEVPVTDLRPTTVTATTMVGRPGEGLPAGGTDGQVLTKTSATDFATAWETPAGGGGGADDQTAAEVPFTPAGTVEATDVQAAIIEVSGDVTTETAARVAGDTDAKARANHTGTQAVATVVGLQAELDAKALASDVDAEETARAAGDSALDVRVDALEAVDPLTQAEGDARYWALTTDLATQAELDAAAAAKQPLDADLTALASAGNSAILAATTASFLTADETKLDGIEALADVTDATNVAAAGAVMVEGSITKIDGPMTQAAYDLLTPDAGTLYVVVG